MFGVGEFQRVHSEGRAVLSDRITPGLPVEEAMKGASLEALLARTPGDGMVEIAA